MISGPAAEGSGGPPRRAAGDTAWHVGLLVLAVAVCYANAIRAPFAFDDDEWIRDNPWIGKWARGPSEPSSRRIAYLTLKLNYLLGGLDPAGYHAFNVAIHVLTSIAVYALARTLLSRNREDAGGATSARAALAGALLFAVHPIQTQAVTYVVQRMASMAGLFYVSALAFYAAARTRRPRGVQIAAYAAALAAAALGARTKETLATLPFAVLLIEALFFGGRTRDRVLAVAPFLAPLVIVSLLVVRSTGSLAAAASAVAAPGQHVLSRLDYLATESRVVLTYVRLLFIPIGQNLDHDYPEEHGFGSPAVIASCVAIAFLLGCGGWLARRRDGAARLAGFGIVLFFLALSVESGAVPIADVIFEHRVYLPSAGAALAVAALAHRALLGGPRSARGAVAAVAACAVALGAATVRRNDLWRDPVALWRDVTEKSPRKARGHYDLGNALKDAGDLDGAVASWTRAVEIDPAQSLAWSQLGNAAYARGDLARAETLYRRALAAPMASADAFHNLALVLEATGRIEEAVACYRKFVESAPPGREPEVESVRARFGWR